MMAASADHISELMVADSSMRRDLPHQLVPDSGSVSGDDLQPEFVWKFDVLYRVPVATEGMAVGKGLSAVGTLPRSAKRTRPSQEAERETRVRADVAK